MIQNTKPSFPIPIAAESELWAPPFGPMFNKSTLVVLLLVVTHAGLCQLLIKYELRWDLLPILLPGWHFQNAGAILTLFSSLSALSRRDCCV